MRLSKNFTTHLPMLMKCVNATDGPIMELGGGYFSTPVLHWMCHAVGRYLLTYDDDAVYFPFIKGFRSRNHRVRLIDDWNTIDTKTHWSVVLVDHTNSITQRVESILKLKDSADFIVVHDTEQRTFQKELDEINKNFKYVYQWKGCTPNTSVLSNFKDITKL